MPTRENQRAHMAHKLQHTNTSTRYDTRNSTRVREQARTNKEMSTRNKHHSNTTPHPKLLTAGDSAQEHIQIGAGTNGQRARQLCNGVAGKGRTCYNFTEEFTDSFNSWHLWATNHSQDLLSKSTGGPVICGPEAMYGHNM